MFVVATVEGISKARLAAVLARYAGYVAACGPHEAMPRPDACLFALLATPTRSWPWPSSWPRPPVSATWTE